MLSKYTATFEHSTNTDNQATCLGFSDKIWLYPRKNIRGWLLRIRIWIYIQSSAFKNNIQFVLQSSCLEECFVWHFLAVGHWGGPYVRKKNCLFYNTQIKLITTCYKKAFLGVLRNTEIILYLDKWRFACYELKFVPMEEKNVMTF
jgi:hypothetical protein